MCSTHQTRRRRIKKKEREERKRRRGFVRAATGHFIVLPHKSNLPKANKEQRRRE
jgi:hypothetical protein